MIVSSSDGDGDDAVDFMQERRNVTWTRSEKPAKAKYAE